MQPVERSAEVCRRGRVGGGGGGGGVLAACIGGNIVSKTNCLLVAIPQS